MIIGGFTRVNRYFPAYANEPHLERRLFCHIQGRKGRQACHNRLLRGIGMCQINPQSYPEQPLDGKHPLSYIHSKIHLLTRDHEPLHGFLVCQKSHQTSRYEQNSSTVSIRFGSPIIARLHGRTGMDSSGIVLHQNSGYQNRNRRPAPW